MTVSAELKMKFWPVLSAASDVATLTLDFSYALSALSYLLISYASLLKYCGGIARQSRSAAAAVRRARTLTLS